MRLSKKEMELDIYVITDLTQLSSAGFKWCMTSPSSVENRTWIHSHTHCAM